MIGLISLVIKNLSRRKLRSWLTIIGIVVGVLAIVSLMSLSQGLQENITKEFDKLGSRKITITSKLLMWGGSSDTGFSDRDMKEIDKIFDVEYVMPSIDGSVRVFYNNEIVSASIIGYDIDNLENYFNQENSKLFKGSFFTNSKLKQIIIGYDYYNNPDNLFKKRVDIGKRLKINNEYYTVIGIMEDTGNPSTNKTIYTSIENIREIVGVDDEVIDKIFVIVKENRNVDMVGERIEDRLERLRKKDDFDVTTPSKTAEQQKEMLNIVSIVVIGIACISLLVGGVGIMNSMYTSVVERRKEIGILKAIGATQANILSIFLLEAGILGLIGGVLGTLGGLSLAIIVSYVSGLLGTQFSYSTNIFIFFFGFGFSFIVGIVSGFYPAYKASKQEAIESLREE